MAEIKLHKRYKFAGDIFKILIEKCGCSVETATSLLNEIPDADVVEQTTLERIVERLEQQAEQYRNRGFEHESKNFSAMADKYYGKQYSYLHAIEIVKKEGGLND